MGGHNGKYTAKTASDVLLDKHKPLDKEDLKWLLGIYRNPDASEEDKKAAHELIVIHNLRLVRGITNSRAYRHGNREDTFNAGFIGLAKAIEGYDPDKVAFSTYAFRWIFKCLEEHREHGNIIYVPEHRRITIRKYQKAYESMRQKLQGDPTKEAVLEESGIDRICEDPNELIRHNLYDFIVNDSHEVDLADPDEIVYFEYDRTSLDAIIADPNGKPVGERLENKEFIEKVLPKILNTLTERELYIVRKRFLEGKTLREVADTLSLSRSRIGQLEGEAIRKMKWYAENHHPEYFPGNV